MRIFLTLKQFSKNIEKYLSKNTDYTFINNDFRKINYESIGKHNVYLFDGPHHLKIIYGVKITQPALSEKYIFIVDDWNWDQVRDGTTAAIEHLKLNVISKLEIRTTHDGSNALAFGQNSDWHQGYCFFVIKNNYFSFLKYLKITDEISVESFCHIF